MVMGRMVYNFTSRARLFGIKAWRFTLYFVLLDIIAFIVQAGGASIASGQDKPRHTILLGLHIYMGGVGFQEFFVLIFCYIAFRFSQQIKRENPIRLAQAQLLILIEYASGLDSSIPNHEVYQYIFDTLPMLFALVVYNVIHPGRIMPGKESDFPSRKERRNYFLGGNQSENSSQMLPITKSTGSATMPEAAAFQSQKQDEVPSYGYVR
ncbi:MAG: hypothetical protein Q9228_006179 [Teloschistes exilis]